jgi:hypothetical protein
MTRPRKILISLADTPYYHITSPLRAPRLSMRCRSLLGPELRTSAAMGCRSDPTAVVTFRHRCLCLFRDEQSLSIWQAISDGLKPCFSRCEIIYLSLEVSC